MFKISDHELALIAVTNSRVLQLLILDTNTLNLSKADIDEFNREDFTIMSQYYNASNQTILFSGYLESLQYQLLDECNNVLREDFAVDNIIYEYDLNTGKCIEVVRDSGAQMVSLVGDGDYVYYKITNTLDPEYRVIQYNRNTKKK